MNKRFIFVILIFYQHCFSFNFLVDLFFGMLPQPVRSAFKGEGLVTDQLIYGYGNSNFTTFNVYYTELSFKEGAVTNIQNHKFNYPTFSLFGGYISHVSTPVFLTVYPGWQAESEVGYGGIDRDNVLKGTRSIYFHVLSGFNWRVYQSEEIKNFSWTLNLGFGYKYHSIIKEQLYWTAQVAVLLIPNILSFSLEYFTTLQGKNLLFPAEPYKCREYTICHGINFILSKKYVLKLSLNFKTLSYREEKVSKELKLNFYGTTIALLTN